MTVNFIIIAIMCSFNSFIGAMLWTRYEKLSQGRLGDMQQCGEPVASLDYCAVRVVNNTCEPLTSDWCESKHMSPDGTYFIKRAITDVPEKTLVDNYNRPMAVILGAGSELIFRFMLHPGWTEYGINFKDNSGNIVFHIKLRSPDDFYFGCKNSGSWYTREGHINTFSFTVDAMYTLRIVCDTSNFQVYLNGKHEWTYAYQLPVTSIRLLTSHFLGTSGDLYRVSYRTDN